MNIKMLLGEAKRFTSVQSPHILIGVGIVGIGTTSYLAVSGYRKARDEDPDFDDLPVKEKVKTSWKFFAPAAVSAVCSASAIIFAQRISDRRQTALAGLYAMSEKALVEYKDKIVEVVGDKKATEIRERISQDHIKDAPKNINQVMVFDSQEQLCHDAWSGRYFKSSRALIEKERNEANQLIIMEGTLSANEFYARLGLEYVDAGNIVGWDTDHMIDFTIDAVIGPDDKPCLSIQHRNNPRPYIRYGN